MIKKIIFANLLAISLLSAEPVWAFQTRAPNEVAGQIGHYSQKLSKTAFYVETIVEGINYVQTIGKLKINAVMESLKSGVSDLKDFQNMLHFSDASSFTSFLKDSASETVLNEIGASKEDVGFVEDEMADEEDEYDDEDTNDEEDASNEKDGSKTSNSSAQKVIVVKSNFGKPQKNKEAAQKFIRSRYYYSTKEGDVYDGEPLSETDEARSLVWRNRVGYYQEVLATSVATAYENLTKVKEDSLKKLQELKQEASKAESIDEKRAVEALIVQEEIRQRMLRLSLDLASLEKDLVAEMQSTETAYIIARTAEQIEQDTRNLMNNTSDEKGGLALKGEE